ncbi:MAG: hypothetical protein HC848_04065 [Limnobacter sp.]|nr:hypothetical protein [Limnobacter sp.]
MAECNVCEEKSHPLVDFHNLTPSVDQESPRADATRHTLHTACETCAKDWLRRSSACATCRWVIPPEKVLQFLLPAQAIALIQDLREGCSTDEVLSKHGIDNASQPFVRQKLQQIEAEQDFAQGLTAEAVIHKHGITDAFFIEKLQNQESRRALYNEQEPLFPSSANESEAAAANEPVDASQEINQLILDLAQSSPFGGDNTNNPTARDILLKTALDTIAITGMSVPDTLSALNINDEDLTNEISTQATLLKAASSGQSFREAAASVGITDPESLHYFSMKAALDLLISGSDVSIEDSATLHGLTDSQSIRELSIMIVAHSVHVLGSEYVSVSQVAASRGVTDPSIIQEIEDLLPGQKPQTTTLHTMHSSL